MVYPVHCFKVIHTWITQLLGQGTYLSHNIYPSDLNQPSQQPNMLLEIMHTLLSNSAEVLISGWKSEGDDTCHRYIAIIISIYI